MDKDKTKIEDERYEFNSVKIAHELMVDILGGLIPGALFLFSIILCVVFPIICYATPHNKFGFLMKDGDWFWIVAFLSFLILSYVIGHIFYRTDIKVPDRMDIRREQMKKLISFLDGMPTGTAPNESKASLFYKCQRVIYSANLLLSEVSPLVDAMQECREDTPRDNPYDSDYLACCKEVEAFLKSIIRSPEVFVSDFDDRKESLKNFRINLLCVLFPEAAKHIKADTECKNDVNLFENEPDSDITKKRRRCPIYKWMANELFPELCRLPFRSKSVIVNAVKIVPLVNSFRNKTKWRTGRFLLFNRRLNRINKNSWLEKLRIRNFKDFEPFNLLMVAYIVLHMQNESGCATEKRCDFPYISYYKYLLKRKQYKLLKYVVWNNSSARTKNQINNYKIELQLFVPNAYSIISKNESHIRMASSTWHVAKTIKDIAEWILGITIVLSGLSCAYHAINNIQENSLNQQHNINCLSPDVASNEIDSESNKMANAEINHHFSSDDAQVDINVKKTIPSKIDHTHSIRNSSINNNNSNSIPYKDGFVGFVNKFLPFIVGESPTNSYLSIIFPFITLLFMNYLLDNVPRFIHYQRLREIFYTLQVYNIWQEAKRAKSRKNRHDLNIRRAEVGLPPLTDICEDRYYF